MKIKERKKRRKKNEIKFREWNWNAWCFKVTPFPVFYFVKIRNGSPKLRSIFLVISVIQNRKKKNKKTKTKQNKISKNWENKEDPKTRNKKESKPKSNLNLSNKKTQYKVIFHIEILKNWEKCTGASSMIWWWQIDSLTVLKPINFSFSMHVLAVAVLYSGDWRLMNIVSSLYPAYFFFRVLQTFKLYFSRLLFILYWDAIKWCVNLTKQYDLSFYTCKRGKFLNS